MKSPKQQSGDAAERRAEALLTGRGLTTVDRNYRCKGGEIDLIMRDGDSLVFVEVRLRRHKDFGGSLSSIDQRKQRRLIIAAQHYLQRQRWQGPCRFDVVGFDGSHEANWIKDAFSA